MILQRNEIVEVYQVEFSLKKREKQSPFIAILKLALEIEQRGNHIYSDDVKDKLFSNSTKKSM
jgi:hypothetical protein